MILENGHPLRQGKLITVINYLFSGFASAASVLVLFALWYLAALHINDELILPQPLQVLQRSWQILLTLADRQLLITLYRAGIGLILAIVIGVGIGILSGIFKTAIVFCRPLVSVLLGVPPIIWVVLALFWFSGSNFSVIFTILVSVIPLNFASAARGIVTVDQELKEMAAVYNFSWGKQIRYLYIPNLLSYLLPSLSLSIGIGIKITIMAELLGASDGIGALIQQARAMLDAVDMMAYVLIVLGIIFVVEYLILEPLHILLMPWESQRVAPK